MTVFQIYADARESIRRNWTTVVLYLGLGAGLSLTVAGVEWILCHDIPKDVTPPWLAPYRFSQTLVFAFIYSTLQALCFSRLGREIDKPAWKCPGDIEALRRFFPLWLIVNLSLSAIQHLMGNALEAEIPSLALLLYLAHMTAFVVLLPAGACVMFHGRLHWPELGEALQPFAALFPLTMGVMLLMLGQYMAQELCIGLYATLRDSPAGIAFAVFADQPLLFIDLFAFAAMWRVCMIHRDTPYEAGSDDFDF